MTRKPAPRWWEAHPGAVVALALALAGGWLVEVRRNASTATSVALTLERRDREIDSLERRVGRLEEAFQRFLEWKGDGPR